MLRKSSRVFCGHVLAEHVPPTFAGDLTATNLTSPLRIDSWVCNKVNYFGLFSLIESIQVFVRIKPDINLVNPCISTSSGTTIVLDSKPPKNFSFDWVADSNATQEEIFNVSLLLLIISKCIYL